MAKKAKRNALEAIMPNTPVEEEAQNDSVTSTEKSNNNSDTNKEGRPRRRRPLKEKAVRQTYSLYPRIIKGIEKYAEARGMNYSQVITMCVTEVIPPEYFEFDSDE